MFIVLLVIVVGCKKDISSVVVEPSALRQEVDEFLQVYNNKYKQLYYNSSLAEWDANTRIVSGDDTNAQRVQKANEELAQFTRSFEKVYAILVFSRNSERKFFPTINGFFIV